MLKQHYKNGSITTEFAVSLAVITIIAIAMAKLIPVIGRANLRQLARQQCIAAGQAQLDSIAATGETIDQHRFQELWPSITSSVIRTPGTGQWQGLQLVEVITISDRTRKPVKVHLRRYLIESDEE